MSEDKQGLEKFIKNNTEPHDFALEKRINKNLEPSDFPPSMEVLDRQDKKNNIKLKTRICYWTMVVVSLYLMFIGII